MGMIDPTNRVLEQLYGSNDGAEILGRLMGKEQPSDAAFQECAKQRLAI